MDDSAKITLENKLVRVVNTSEGIDNTGIISFMYPSFISKSEIFFDYENNIIFTGKNRTGLRQELEHGTKSFIALVSNGMFDIDFTNRETAIKVLYSKWDKEPTDDTRKILESMTENDFWDYFKKFWILGTSKSENKGVTIYDLYKVLGKQKFDILKVYFRLREVYEDSTIFSAVLSFIEKALNPDQVSSQNGLYIKMLREFSESYKGQMIPIIKRAYMMKSDTSGEREYRTLWVLMQLGKGNII